MNSIFKKNGAKNAKEIKLEPWEQEILGAFERGELVSVSEKEKEEFRKMAQNTLKNLKKRKSISIRISERDLLKVKTKAFEEGLPYQTYISSIIHKHVNRV